MQTRFQSSELVEPANFAETSPPRLAGAARRMSQNRIRTVSGHHYDGTIRIIHANGRPSCRWCQGSVPKPRRTFCGAECVHQWKLRTRPSYLRARVWARDRGICAECGVDAKSWARSVKSKITRGMKAAGLVRGGSGDAAALVRKIEQAALRAYGLTSSRSSFWDADHIVPVAEGGGECDLANLRTLCLKCHKAASKQLAARLAEARRAASRQAEAVGVEG